MTRALVSITHIKSMAMAQVVLEPSEGPRVTVLQVKWPEQVCYDSRQLQLEKPCLVKSNFAGLSFGWG